MIDILLIEDDSSTIRLVKSFFEFKGLRVRGVLSAINFMEEIRKTKPKVILTDIMHPGPDGFTICIEIKSHQEFKQIPVFYFTARPCSEVKRYLEETGANGCIPKPFSFKDLEFLLNFLK